MAETTTGTGAGAQPATFGERIIWLIVERLTAPQFILSMVSTALFYWLLNSLLHRAIPDNARELVSAALGFLIGQMVGPGYQFYLGNTSSAAKKDEALASSAKAMQQAGLNTSGQGLPTKPPVDVNVVNPYADKTDEDLRTLLKDRRETPDGMTREEMLKRLAELDAATTPEPVK